MSMSTMVMIVLAAVAGFGIALLAGLLYGDRLHSKNYQHQFSWNFQMLNSWYFLRVCARSRPFHSPICSTWYWS